MAWVHLVKPYGLLRFVPWERLLPDIVQAPVLMLPDFIFPPPRKSASGLDIAVCASAPLNCEHYHVFEALQIALEAILSGLQVQSPTIHVFTDLDMAHHLGQLQLPNSVRIHDPAGAAPYVVSDPSSRLYDQAGSLRSPWLLWMCAAMQAYSTDIVHFICHGHLSAQSGAMLFAQSPLERTDDFLAGPVGSAELAGFMTRIGAWGSGFSSPADNHSPAGLRGLADEIAQSMPGPMMLYDGRFGPPLELANGYQFVLTDSPQLPTVSRALYLYCQPYLLAEDRGFVDERSAAEATYMRVQHYARNSIQRDSAMQAITSSLPSPTSPGPLADFSGGNISAITAATERFAERVQLQYQRLTRDELIPERIAQDDMQASMETVDLIRQAVSMIEQQRLATDIGAGLDTIEVNAPALGTGSDIALKPILEQLSQLRALQAQTSINMTALPDMIVHVDASPLEQRTQQLLKHMDVDPQQLLQKGQAAEP